MTISRVVLSCVLGVFALSAARAQESWTVNKASGEVWVVTTGAQNVALTPETALKGGDSIRTGQNGRVMLRRGQETILISPNSAVGLPAEAKAGATTIIQQAGSILLEVSKRDARTFEVETPYLVAAVKGTQFRVTVGAKGADVNVQHGSVEVADVKTGKFALVLPGQSANVSTVGAGGLSLHGVGTLSPIQNGTPRASTIGPIPVPRGGLTAPASIRASLQAPARATTAGNQSGGLRIAAPIGQVKLDVATATRGLAREAGAPVANRSASTIWNPNPSNNAATDSVSASNPAASNNPATLGSTAINSSAGIAAVSALTGAGNQLGGGDADGPSGKRDRPDRGSGKPGKSGGSSGPGNSGAGHGHNGQGSAAGGQNGPLAGPAGNGHGAGKANGPGPGGLLANGGGPAGNGNGNANGAGNGKGNNGNGNGNGGGNGSNAGGNGNGNANGNGNGGGNGQGNNGNGNGNGGGNGSNAGGNGNGNGNGKK